MAREKVHGMLGARLPALWVREVMRLLKCSHVTRPERLDLSPPRENAACARQAPPVLRAVATREPSALNKAPYIARAIGKSARQADRYGLTRSAMRASVQPRA